MKWLKKVDLELDNLKLEPLSETHLKGLREAVEDGELWNLWYTTAPYPDDVSSFIDKALTEFNKDRSLAFAVIESNTNKVIGTTRFMNADAHNRRLEIGTTWYAKSYQKTGVNYKCKLLLLQYAFEILNCIAVEFRTHWHNLNSRNAIAKLGAKQDGILRNHKFDRTGNLRDTVVFSIIDSEWKTVKQSLLFKIHKKYPATQ